MRGTHSAPAFEPLLGLRRNVRCNSARKSRHSAKNICAPLWQAAEKLCVLKGHGFSRAAGKAKQILGFSP
jgi:hypothetical protein